MQVPAIYSPRVSVSPVSLAGRGWALAVAAGCLGVLITAAKLVPSPTGIGTHTELGMFPCAFLARTGLPCPTCGMTTSFAWFVRGNWVASFYVQPMGFVTALLTVAAFWVGLYVAVSGRGVYRLLRFVPGRYYGVPLTALAILAWAWKIYIHLHGLDGWSGS
jgi:hypothetical protein